jgi:PemK-like, MazF-like toxin of type II toxin-antitoxin system
MRQMVRRLAERVRALVRPAPRASTNASARPTPSAVGAPTSPAVPRPPNAPPVTTSPHPPPGRHLAYAPHPRDGAADPGEIVWFWVPYEEQPHLGKDRPVLVVGRDGNVLLGLMLSTQQARDGRPDWLALGSGDWDHDHRASWVRLDRVLQVPASGVRREGSILDRARFDAVAEKLRRYYGWQ